MVTLRSPPHIGRSEHMWPRWRIPISELIRIFYSSKMPTFPGPTLVPALKPIIHLPVTISVAVVVALITIFIAYFFIRECWGNWRISNFNTALVVTFGWGVLRTVLFVLYTRNNNVAAHLTVSALVISNLAGVSIPMPLYHSCLLAIRSP